MDIQPAYRISYGCFIKSAMLTLFIIVLCKQICAGQEDFKSLKQNRPVNIVDSTIRNEIATFNKKNETHSSQLNLEEIPLKKCSHDFAYFYKLTKYFYDDITAIISSEGSTPNTRMKQIYLRFGRYRLLILPDSVVTDIYNPKFCEKRLNKGKAVLNNCKVFRSRDKKRLYIYILNDDAANRYEVTWVIQDEKYYTRVIDQL